MDQNSILEILADKLKTKIPSSVHAVIGFDGFVDDVVHVVKKRIDKNNYIRELTLKDYGERIAASSGLSTNVEIVTLSKKLGGNGTILANALIELGVKMSYIGAVGYPDINPVYYEMTSRCENVFPVCNPSSTDAMEFEDGKIIRTKLSAFQELTFDAIKERVGLDVLAKLLDESTLIGFENWALPPYSGQIWRGILDEVMPLLKKSTAGKILFFDIADPCMRQEQEFRDVMNTIESFSNYYHVILGLNLCEAVQVADLFGGSFDYSETDLEALARYIARHIDIGTLVIHPLKEACCLKGDEFFIQKGPYCEKPKLTTGAGDNFNSGFVLGEILGLEPAESLLLGMASSGFYVRNGRSAHYEELIEFLILWSKGALE